MQYHEMIKKLFYFTVATCIVLFLTVIIFSYHPQDAFANTYNECEGTNATLCNPGGNTQTGHIISVTNNNGNYTCSTNYGQFQCNRPYWGQCGGSFINGKTPGVCWAGLAGTKPSAQALYGPKHAGDGTACGSQAGTWGIGSYADLYCVCNVGGAAPCPTSTNPSPTSSSIPTPTTPPAPTSIPATTVTLVLGLPGIGYNGIVGIQPKHLTRAVTIQLYDATVANPSGPGTTPLATSQGVVSYDAGSDSNAGYFVSTTPITLSLPTNPPVNNQYEILVKMPQYLYQLAVNPVSTDGSGTINHAYSITVGSHIVIPPLILNPGDVAITNGGLNHIKLDDYTVMLGCYGANANSASCLVKPATQGDLNLADLNDDGVVDIVDLNIWLRSLFALQNAQAPGCDTADCQGD